MYLDKRSGFTLTEVLIALVVLSIGLLGLASLQAESLKKSNDAYMSSIASNFANDIIDRMRANFHEAQVGSYVTNSATNDGTQLLACLGGVPNGGGSGGNVNASCTEAQMSRNDIFEWQRNIANTLPNGTGFICLSNNPGNLGSSINCNNQGEIYVIAITWRDRDGQTEEYRVAFKP